MARQSKDCTFGSDASFVGTDLPRARTTKDFGHYRSFEQGSRSKRRSHDRNRNRKMMLHTGADQSHWIS
jgi:hypothetical protein